MLLLADNILHVITFLIKRGNLIKDQAPELRY